MALATKGLWAEFISNNQRLQRLQNTLTATGANLLCIRTESPYVIQLIQQLHQNGTKVYGWMWPHSKPATADPADDPAYAPNEMNRAIDLIKHGLDGYVFDIESNNDGKPSDWDSKGPPNRAQIARDMVSGIAAAFKARGTPYVLGLTSHQWGFTNYPHIPWQEFLNECTVLFPQTYWRFDNGNVAHKACVDEATDYVTGHVKGTPDQAIYNGFKDYANKKNKAGNVLPIVPVGGEIGCSKVGEMAHFGALVAQRGLTEAHFYVDVDKPGWDPVNHHDTDLRVIAEIKAL